MLTKLLGYVHGTNHLYQKCFKFDQKVLRYGSGWTGQFQNYIPPTLSGDDQFQPARTQIMPYKMSGLIWIKTVCKGYKQITLVGKEFS